MSIGWRRPIDRQSRDGALNTVDIERTIGLDPKQAGVLRLAYSTL